MYYALCCSVRTSQRNIKRLYHTDKGVYGYIPRDVGRNEIPNSVFRKRHQNCNVNQLINAFRTHGHKMAKINPINYKHYKNEKLNVLEPERYGLTNISVDIEDLLYTKVDGNTIEQLVEKLKQIYCGEISYEFTYLENEDEIEWMQRMVEDDEIYKLNKQYKYSIVKDLLESQVWDNFLATKFPSVKRYGGEGAESMLIFFRTLIESSANADVEQLVLGIPHRGKLNLLTGLLQTPPVKIFHKFKGNPEFPPDVNAMCDIATHFHASVDISVGDKKVHISMLHNPSHLEVVNPVSMGKTRSKQMEYKEGDYDLHGESRLSDKIINIQLHGDGAFVGQGVNQECIMLSRAPHFDVGGTIHMIVNNQIAFTAPADRGRSSRYTTDLAKITSSPVIHVNADNPELVYKASKIAFEYQRRYRKDIFIDLNCFRRWGHNELDDPTFTNPALYKVIHNRKSIPDIYAERMVAEGVITREESEKIISDYNEVLQKNLDLVESYKPEESYFKEQWLNMTQARNAVEIWNTGVDETILKRIGLKSVEVPSGFTIHPHLEKTYVKNRLKKVNECREIDWATAEIFAFGSLLLDGHNVRLSGEDVGRGTFSQRHAMLVDNKTNQIYIPLNDIDPEQKGYLEVANSLLSEEAVLGYEYGMSIDTPNNLIIWEAQFGDFFNGAQILYDTYISSGETKWMRSNGLVTLLPHGYDGAASDHSSCRMERFLQMTDSKESAVDGDDVNMHVVNPTTPAQYFHLLRRQMVRDYRKPLVVVAPKILLRHSAAVSDIGDFGSGTYFDPVIGDSIAEPINVKRVIFVSGKHYYALNEERVKNRINDVAIIRLESLCPFPVYYLNEQLKKYKNARVFIWSQEEHRNMGAWSFVSRRFENLVARKLKYSGRVESATPAVGCSKWHQAEAHHIVQEPLYLIK